MVFKDIITLEVLLYFSYRFERWQSFSFCSVSDVLAQTSQPKINSEKHFPPGLEHNKYKVGAVTLTLTWKLSQAEVRGEKINFFFFFRLVFMVWQSLEHIVFIYLFYFRWQGRGELSFSFFL